MLIYKFDCLSTTFCFREKIQIGSGNYDVMKDRNGKVCLFINRMTEREVGTYSCHATNEHGDAWKKIKLLEAGKVCF